MRYLVLALTLAFAATAAADPLVSEQRTVKLRYEEVVLGGTALDVEVEWRPRNSVRVTGDVFASLGEHDIRVPTKWVASYDPARVEGGQRVQVYLKAYTETDLDDFLQEYGVGWESTIAIGYDTFFGWLEAGWGLDLGIDAIGFGRPPMAGETSVASDTIQTGMWVPPGPPGIVPTLAEVVLQLGSRLEEGWLMTTVDVVGNATFGTCSGMDEYSSWLSPGDQLCIEIDVDPAASMPETIDIELTNLQYVVETAVPLGLIAKILGGSFPTVPLGAIPTSTLVAETTESITFSLPVIGTPADLIAGHITGGADLRRLWPETSYTVYGHVINNDKDDGVSSPSMTWLEIRPVGGSTWDLVGTVNAGPLNQREKKYVIFTLPGNTYAPGDYDLRLTVDATDALFEPGEGENNNQSTRIITVVDIPPDLTPVMDTIAANPTRPRVDQAYDLSVDVTNHARATLTAQNFDVLFELYDSSAAASGVIPPPSWVPIGTATVSSLAPGDTTTATISVPAPSSSEVPEPGGSIVRVMVDVDDSVDELAESNNHTFDGLRFDATGPDLYAEITDLYFASTPDPPLPSTSVIIWLNVRNGGGSDANGVGVTFRKLTGDPSAPTSVPLGTETISFVPMGGSTQTAILIVPEQADAGDPSGTWRIEAAITPTAGESKVDNNVVERQLYIGDALGNIEARITEENSGPLDGVELTAEPAGKSTTSQGTDLTGEGILNARVNAQITDVPVGAQTVTAAKDGYLSASQDIDILAGQTTYVAFLLEPDPDADLVVDVEPDPPTPTPSPGDQIKLRIGVTNIGGTPALQDLIVVRISLNGDEIADAIPIGGTPGEMLDPGEEVEILWPPETFVPLPPDQDSVIDVEVDPGGGLGTGSEVVLPDPTTFVPLPGAVFEVSDGNNSDSNIVTNPKPIVSIDSVAPNPVDSGQSVSLMATATDPTGQIRASEWESDVDGLIARTEDAMISTLTPGTHQLTFRAYDERDETSEVSTTLVVSDAIGPTVSLIYRASEGLLEPAMPVFVWIGTDDVTPQVGLEYSFFLEGLETNYGDWSSKRDTLYRDLAAGSYTLRVRARDAAGNVSAEPIAHAFTVESQPGDGTGDGTGGGGCGCTIPGTSTKTPPLTALLLLLAFTFRRGSFQAKRRPRSGRPKAGAPRGGAS